MSICMGQCGPSLQMSILCIYRSVCAKSTDVHTAYMGQCGPSLQMSIYLGQCGPSLQMSILYTVFGSEWAKSTDVNILYLGQCGPSLYCILGWSVEIFFDRTEQVN